MSYQQNISACLRDKAEFGLSAGELNLFLEALVPALGRLRTAYQDKTIPLLRIPERTDDWPALKQAAERYRACFDD